MGVCVCVLYQLNRDLEKTGTLQLYRKTCWPTRGNTDRGRSLLSIGGWWRGIVVSGVRHMNEVNACQARLVLGWVTVFGQVYRLDM